MSLLQRALEERARVWSRMNEIRDTAAAENRGLTAEERTNWDEAEARLAELTGDIEREQRFANHDSQLGAIADEQRTRAAEAAGGATTLTDEQRYEEAFRSWVRHGDMAPAEHRALVEQRAQSVGTNSAGGYFVPSGYRAVVTETLKAYGGILRDANVITTETGNPLPWPGVDDTGNVGAILAENTQVSAQDITVTQKTLNAWTYTSKLILVSLQLMQDSAFDLDTYVPFEAGKRLGRAIAAHLATGDGSSKPTGIGYNPTTGKTGATGQTTSVIYDDLVDLLHSVDPAYRANGNCKFYLADSSLAAIRKIKDQYGHPLWQPSVQAGVPDTLLGYGVTVDNGLPAMAANAKSILFGDMKAGLLVRQVLDIQMLRLVERYGDYLQVGFIGFTRVDAKPDDASAVKAYVNSAT